MSHSLPTGMSLSDLLRGWLTVTSAQDHPITGLTLDSRCVAPGDLFCALRGTRRHGLDLAAEAVTSGAVAILAEADPSWPDARLTELAAQLKAPLLILPKLGQHLSAIAGRFYGAAEHPLDAIAVTGTNGKTSICHFLAHAFGDATHCGLIGTLGYGFADDLLETGCTTPDAIRLQAILADLYKRGAQAVALEASSHALDQGRLAGVPVKTAIFTNLTRDHLDYHGDLAQYAQAKTRLFQMPGLHHAVLNADDPFGHELLAVLDPVVQAVLYSVNPALVPPAAPVRWLQVEKLTYQARSMRLQIAGSWGQGDCVVPVLGRFNASNLLAVLAVLLLRGLSLETALQRLAQVRGVPGRLECFGQDSQPLVVVDYAHTPDALEQALNVLREQCPQRLITLFGCGGERDRGKRPLMGEVAERLSDYILLTDDNPRSEDGAAIVQDILSGIQIPAKVAIERHRDRAIEQAIRQARSSDCVLIAGKGHETTQQIGTVHYPFSDRAEVLRALSLWRPPTPSDSGAHDDR